ncbi:ribonuclease T2-like [Triplophysa rosa]|uniref:Ribonuclease T2 n=1 Tax=Triplophysa rosa TaxID=992332 RepID=A0A9W7WI65_TRIRA|nr:ribonuclease T2-like [Triplophysa rosa]KAI7800461.1 putative ribonuclease T2 [Triplophysa rosa]
MIYKGILWAFTAVLFTGWVFTYDEDQCSDKASRHSCNWTCMLLTLQWPGSFCISLNNTNICKIPQTVQNWTIHGLWPEHTGHCCDCWPIFHSHLQDIEPDLSQLWPSLVKAKNYFIFWKEEWIKHGTCAGCDETMGSPVHYFQTAIKLRKLYDIDSVLKTSGIETSCDVSYKYDDISSVLEPLFGRNYDLQCVTDKKGRQVWVQLKINLFRNQTLGCHKQEQKQLFNTTAWLHSPGHPCPKNESIFYFPINYEQPHEPCNSSHSRQA